MPSPPPGLPWSCLQRVYSLAQSGLLPAKEKRETGLAEPMSLVVQADGQERALRKGGTYSAEGGRGQNSDGTPENEVWLHSPPRQPDTNPHSSLLCMNQSGHTSGRNATSSRQPSGGFQENPTFPQDFSQCFLCAAGNRKPLAHHFPPEVSYWGDNTLMRHENMTIYTRGVFSHRSQYNIHKSLSCSLLEPPPVHGAWYCLAGAEQISAEQMHQGRNVGAPWRTNAVLTSPRCHREPNLCVVVHGRCAGGLEAEPGFL